MKNMDENNYNDSYNDLEFLNFKHSENYTNIYSSDPPKKENYVDIYSSERKKERKKRRKIPFLRILSFILFLLLGVAGAAMLYVYNTLHSFNYNDLSQSIPGVSETTTAQTDENTDLLNDSMILNVLLIGSDSMSVGDHGRSDSLLILSLDIKNKKIKVTSIMRDTWVSIPGNGKDRINAAYAYGGPKLTIETIQKNFGILIDRYACVDFDGFSKIIDSLGGIDIELTAKESSYINTYSGDKHLLRGQGMKHLTGLQALHHSRNRNSAGSDYDRTTRQRNVIKAAINKLKVSNPAKITEMISTLAPLVTTNFKIAEISRLATNSLTYLNYPMEEYRIPTDNNVRNETYDQKMVLVINDAKKARNDLAEFIYEPSSKN